MTQPDIAEIARGLTAAQRDAVDEFMGMWRAGPDLPGKVLRSIYPLMTAGVLEREFLDEGPPVHSTRGGEKFVKVTACWHYRHTPLGIAIANHIKGTTDDE